MPRALPFFLTLLCFLLAGVFPAHGKPGRATPAPALADLTFDATNQLSAFPGRTVSYDLDGNMTHGPLPDGSQGTFAFDDRNRLTGAGGTTVTYDAEGLRKTVTEAGADATYVMDASGPGKVLQRTKGGAVTRYVWGVGLCYEVDAAGAATTYHYDATGSTIALTDDSAKIIERVEYSPYGLVTRRWNATKTYHDTPFLYTGMLGNETDASGLIHMRARYYHPLLGRFLNGDPAREGWNWYAYAGGNPLGYVDPSGLGSDRALDVVQTALSFVGLVPGVGIAADVLNAGISLGRGNYGEAAMYTAGAVTGGILGMAAGMEINATRTAMRVESGIAREAVGAAEMKTGIPEFTFRGDTRVPSEVFEQGFAARGSSTDLLAHALDNTAPPSAFIPTSRSASVAGDFAEQVYTVRPRGGIDVNTALGGRSPFPNEMEIAVPYRIAPSDIRAVTFPQQGFSTLNPNWMP